MAIKYYKIKYGFNESDYCTITDQELPKAYGMHMSQEGVGIFSDGTSIRAKDIIRIEPDWHKVRGWNRGWKMTADDYEDIHPLERSYKATQLEAKDIVDYLLKNRPNDLGLLSKPMNEIKTIIGISNPERKNLPGDISDDISGLVNKFKI